MNKFNGEFSKASCNIGGTSIFGKLQLTDNYLVHQKFTGQIIQDLKNLESVSFNSKILILPTVLGGISSPLFMVAGFNGVGNIWAMIFFSFIGLILLYFGLNKTKTLTLTYRDNTREYDIFLFDMNPDLPDFITVISHLINTGRSFKSLFTIELSEEERAVLAKEETLNYLEKGKALQFNYGHNSENIFTLKDPIGMGLKIIFTMNQGSLQPVLFGSIDISMLSKTD